MPKIRYLRIRFSNKVFSQEIPYFRAAVIEGTQRKSSLFHNHAGKDEFLYRYPLIQYKVLQQKAGIICINEGTDDIHLLLQNRQINLAIGNRAPEDFLIEDMQMNYFDVGLENRDYHYSLLNWQALNQHNFKAFQEIQTSTGQLNYLEGILKGHLLAFAKGIGWEVKERIEVRISRQKESKWLVFKGKKVQAFSLHFTSNMTLPDFIGLGKGSSVGFGTVKQLTERKTIGRNKYHNNNY